MSNDKYALGYWHCKHKHGNVGDELSKVIVNGIAGQEVPTIYNSKYTRQLTAVGSWLHKANNGDVVWGTGLRNFPGRDPQFNPKFTSLDVRAVRGPITRDFLLNKNIEVPLVYGDPVLLYPTLFPTPPPVKIFDISLIPHLTHHKNYVNHPLVKSGQIHLIDACDHYTNVIDDIRSSKLVLSTSLHGLIMADSYNVPNKWIRNGLNEGHIKFHDYLYSQQRDPSIYHASVENALKSGQEDHGNKINLTHLLDAFPYDIMTKLASTKIV